MDNQTIAKIFQEIGDMLEILDENPFRVRSYRRATQVISHFPHEIEEIYKQNPKAIKDIPGVGEGLTHKIVELVRTGKCKEYESMLKKFPKGFLDMLRLRTIGPKKVKLFFGQLHIQNIAQLKRAAEKYLLRELPGMGEKSEGEVLEAIEEYEKKPQERQRLDIAFRNAGEYIEYMKKSSDVEMIEAAGSLRRRADAIGDIDILCASKNPAKIMEYFVEYPAVANVLSKGGTKSSVILRNGTQVDLRVVSKNIFGAALHYFTGSKDHNIRIRDIAKRKGLKISEYGVFKGKKLIGGETEEEIFKSVGLPFIPPEMRENRGEIEFALKNKRAPKLIEMKDLRGDLHVHSVWSDGSESIGTIAAAYKKRGFDYIAMTDHSPAIGIAHGLNEKKIKKYLEEIDKINKRLAPFKVFKGSEVDIMRNGELDFSDEILKQLEIVVAAVHTSFNLSEEEQTRRILKALKNPYVKILAHPSGRLINERPAYKVDMEAVIKAAIDADVVLEINSSPARLDLRDIYVKMAKDLGAKFVISTDGHHSSHAAYLQYGIYVARRGWLTASDVINARPIKKALEFFAKER